MSAMTPSSCATAASMSVSVAKPLKSVAAVPMPSPAASARRAGLVQGDVQAVRIFGDQRGAP